MDPTDHLSGCGSAEGDLFPLLENQDAELDNFWAQFSPTPASYNASSSFVPSRNVVDTAGGDFSLIETWLADGDGDTRAGDYPNRQGSAGLMALGAGTAGPTSARLVWPRDTPGRSRA